MSDNVVSNAPPNAGALRRNVIFGDFLHNLLTGLCQDKYIAGVVVRRRLDGFLWSVLVLLPSCISIPPSL